MATNYTPCGRGNRDVLTLCHAYQERDQNQAQQYPQQGYSLFVFQL
jgi:hypothetical protein